VKKIRKIPGIVCLKEFFLEKTTFSEFDFKFSSCQEYGGEEPPAAAKPNVRQEEEDDEKPSDLSFKSSFAADLEYSRRQPQQQLLQGTEEGVAAVPAEQVDAYKKFKSNITQRFSLQDSAPYEPAVAPGSSNGGKNRAGRDCPPPPPPSEVLAPSRVIKTEEDSLPPPPSSTQRRSSHSGDVLSGGGLLLPVIRERLLPPPPPRFPTPDRDFLPPPPTSLLMGGMNPAPASAGDLLMPTLAPIHPTAYPPAAAASRLPAGGPPVPIFALNAKGSYYVPMSVELAVIAPFMALYTEETYSVLHPVTISVNFQVRLIVTFSYNIFV
jgi:hypothetical protein